MPLKAEAEERGAGESLRKRASRQSEPCPRQCHRVENEHRSPEGSEQAGQPVRIGRLRH